MPLLRPLALIAFLAVLSGCDPTAPSACPGCLVDPAELAAIPLQPGLSGHEARLANGTMTFTLHVPDRVRDDMPLVLALHYASDTGRASRPFVEALVEPGLRDLEALILAPDGAAFGPGWGLVLAQQRLLALVDAALKAWPLDPDRVLVVGYSDGGMGTWSLTARAPERFSAGIPVAARPFGGPHGTVPLYLIHGRQDTVFPIAEVEAAYADLQDSGATAVLDVIDAGHADLARYRDALRRGGAWVQQTVWANEPGATRRP